MKRVNLNLQAVLGRMSLMTVLINPSVARAIARGGYSKPDVKRYFFERSRVAIGEIGFECRSGHCAGAGTTIRELIESGWDTPKEWADLAPTDTVPAMGYPGLIEVVVRGDPNRNKAMTLHSVYNRPVARKIGQKRLP